MTHTANPTMNASLLGGFKTILILAVGVFAFFQIDPLSTSTSGSVTVTADSYPFVIPNELKHGYMGQNTQILLAHSLWEFKIKNGGSKDLANVTMEFPFSGSYSVEAADKSQNEILPTFSRQIVLEKLGADQTARVTIWAGEELNPELERLIRVRSGEAVFAVDYPVKASGLVAWIESYKTPLSLGLFILFLITVL